MKNTLMVVACTTLLSGAAFGQWVEVGDAPDGPGARQDTVGNGALTSISGQLNRAGGDHVDTYSIRITNVQQFYASTKIFFGGSFLSNTGTNGDSRLWLWSEAGVGLLGNDDINTVGFGTDTLASFLSDPSTFTALTGGEVVNATAAGVSLQNGVKYLLSISEFTNDPDGAGGVDLFNLSSDFDALHGVNPASGGAFVAWENAVDPSVLDYRIALAGAEFCAVPAPGAMAIFGLAGLAGLGRRRRG